MSFQLASAYVELNTKGFRTVSGAIDGIKAKLTPMVAVAGGVAAGVAAIGGAFGALAAVTVPMAARLEQVETQFKTLLGSADAAKKKIEELQNFAASTPFQFEGLADATKTLLGFGIANDQVIPTLKALGDVAAATGNQIGELSGIYGKVRARGALMTETLDQFNERGIPLGEKLSEMFGKTGDEIRSMASTGQISFGDMQRAIQQMTSEGGMAFNGMADQSRTLGGVWSTLKDNITILMTDIGGAIAEGFDLRSVTTEMTSFVQQVRAEWLPSIVDRFRWAADNILKPFSRVFGEIASVAFELVSDMDLYWKLNVASLASHMLDAYQHVSTFFQNGRAIAVWWRDNVVQVFENVYENARSIFGKMTQQIRNNWQSLVNFFATGQLEYDFSPLVDSFNIAMRGIAMPELQSPELGAMQGDIDRLHDQLAQRQLDRLEARRKREAAAAAERVDQLKIEATAIAGMSELPGGEAGTEKKRFEIEQGITAEKKKQRAMSFTSLTGLADEIRERNEDKPQDRPVMQPQADQMEMARAGFAVVMGGVDAAVDALRGVADAFGVAGMFMPQPAAPDANGKQPPAEPAAPGFPTIEKLANAVQDFAASRPAVEQPRVSIAGGAMAGGAASAISGSGGGLMAGARAAGSGRDALDGLMREQIKATKSLLERVNNGIKLAPSGGASVPPEVLQFGARR